MQEIELQSVCNNFIIRKSMSLVLQHFPENELHGCFMFLWISNIIIGMHRCRTRWDPGNVGASRREILPGNVRGSIWVVKVEFLNSENQCVFQITVHHVWRLSWSNQFMNGRFWQVTDLATFRGNIPQPRFGHALAVPEGSGLIYLYGGLVGSNAEIAQNDFYIYDPVLLVVSKAGPSQDATRRTNDPPSARAVSGMVASGTNLYVFGGNNFVGKSALRKKK